jgi:ferric-dicitrate binding protein FerR (iron transport regulator)
VENYKELYFKYLNNRLEGEELKNALQWFKNPANSAQLEKWMEEDWELFSRSDKTDTIETSLDILKSKLRINANKSQNRRLTGKSIYRIAATFLLSIAIGTITYFLLSKTEKKETIVFNEISVPIGSKSKISLADGTVIWLNAGSILRYPSIFAGKTREVELIGEGFFDVKRDSLHPFIVKASDIRIKVLGTSFNVKSYPDERTIETTLVKGLVTIQQQNPKRSNGQVLYLKPNQRATFIKDKGKLILSGTEKEAIIKVSSCATEDHSTQQVLLTKNINTEQFIAWKDNKLIFKNEDFESLSARLERWFDVKIIIENEDLKKFHYTGIIQNETINDVMDILQLTMHFKYKINHSIIEIWNK